MSIITMLDIAPGIFVLFGGINLPVLIVTFALIVVLEGWLLWRLNWAEIRKSLYTSICINILSALVGVFIGLFLMASFRSSQELFSPKMQFILLISWFITIFVEGLILVLMNLRNLRLSIRSTFVINLASYLLLELVLFGLSKINY